MALIKIHNDGKEKKQSFEAYVGSDHSLFGFGENEGEAINELKNRVNERIEELKNIDYTKTFSVDWAGKPLKS